MNEQKFLNGTRLTLVIVSLLIILTAVFLVGFFWGQKNSEQAYQLGYEAGWQSAKEIVDQSGIFPPEPEEINQLVGEITDINKTNHALTMMIEPYNDNPLADSGPLSRTIQISIDTEITKYTPKSLEEFLQEQAAYDEMIEDLPPEEVPGEPPSPYDFEKVDFEAFELGQLVSVHSLEDISEKTVINPDRVGIYLEEEVLPPAPEEAAEEASIEE